MNTIVWGFCGNGGAAIVDALRSRIGVTDSFGDQPGDTSVWSFLLGNVPLCDRHPDAVARFGDFYMAHFHNYNVMVHRRGLFFSNTHDLTNEFALNFHWFYNLLTSRETELVIFSIVPHEGSDYILYRVAKLLGIRTVMCFQTIFANQFLVSTTIEDFGRFDGIPPVFRHESIPLTPGHRQELSYMRDVEAEQAAESRDPTRSAWNRTSRPMPSWLRSALGTLGGAVRKRRINLPNLFRRLLELRLERKYESNLRARVVDRTMLRRLLGEDKRLVYFPMHLQPELTTSAIGGVFQDQLYAIEVLRDLLGPEWTILAKENPKQNHYQRDGSFFRRLSNIGGVLLVDKLFPSVEIIENVSLTATVTGTAGWEAVKGGGKCLAFGQAWFATLENCLTFSQSIGRRELMDFLERPTSDEAFRDSCEELWRKVATGVVDPFYEDMIPGFDTKENAENVANSLMAVIAHPATRWG